uniref:Uncharacterized protein n=1 Tax=Arundo donax TaxID=35708 RepID=A0A0A8ZKZ2_ARUDO
MVGRYHISPGVEDIWVPGLTSTTGGNEEAHLSTITYVTVQA